MLFGFSIQTIVLHDIALLGDVLIHSIPHLLLGDHDDDHHGHGHGEKDHKEDEHDHFKMIYIGVLILVGFLIFFIAEKVATRHLHHHASEESLHENHVLKDTKKDAVVGEKTASPELRSRNVGNRNNQTDSRSKDDTSDGGKITGKEEVVTRASNCYMPSFSRLTASGWLNLLADSMHNFTDGIALGKT